MVIEITFTSDSYGVSERTGGGNEMYIPLAAHEMGHNLGAGHDKDGNFLMYPTLSSQMSKFAPISKSEIAGTLSQIGDCLGTVATVTLPPREAVATGLKANKGNSKTSVRVNWSKVPGASIYQVYRSTTSGQRGTYLGQSLKNFYLDTSGTSATHYWYSVVVIAGPDESPASAQVEGWKR